MAELERFANPIEDKIAYMKKRRIKPSSENIQHHADMHIASSIALSHTHSALEYLKLELGDNLVAAYVVGKVGRNSDARIDQVKLNIVIRDREALPSRFKDLRIIPNHGVIKPNIITQEELDKLLEGSSRKSKQHRADLALDNIALHGIKLVRGWRRHAFQNLTEADFEPITMTQAKAMLKANTTKYGKTSGMRESVDTLRDYRTRASRDLGVNRILKRAKEIQEG
ncbi:hypothetical protein J4220_01720 [Candidatus Micrarchaeota archaeon]|nr:hypothetical protein [Candidatus Micrarchaeota archaeon]HLD62698.1 hypothetical protein [Candidatus Norongarragalinales archaeon]